MKKTLYKGGFSLIELLVSMALFIVVITMGVGALMVLINANAKAQNINDSVSNIQFALDSMAREIRTGYAYFCSNGTETTGDINVHQDCPSKGSYISIIEGGKSLTKGDNNKRIAYRYNSAAQSIERKIGSGNWVRLTNPDIAVTDMHFHVMNSAPKEDGNELQPNVTIYMKGVVDDVSGTGSEFSLQTTVTKRVLDL